MLKIVLDTNMFISASMFGGMVEEIVDLIVENELKLFISSDLIDEVFEKLNEFHANETIIKKVITVLGRGKIVDPEIKISVCRDPEDNFVLELAESSKADYIITRDKDLLDLPGNVWKSTKIIKPENFLPLLRSLKIT